MIFRQFLHAEPVAASYLFGCGGRGVCAVVDPIEDIDLYARAASDTHMRIQYVIDPAPPSHAAEIRAINLAA